MKPARRVMRLALWGLAIGASWLVAIGALTAALPLLPVTPGYLPDHLE